MKKLLLLLLLSFSLISTAYASSHFHDWPDDSICTWVEQRPNNEGYLNEARKRGLVCNGIVYGTSSAQNNSSQEAEKDSKSNDDGLPICTSWFKSNWNNCIGETTLSNGVVYVGEFKNGVRHGQGTSTNPDGTVFVGEFKNDEAFKGKATSPNGVVVIAAEFNSGGQAVKGILTHPNGTNFNFDCKILTTTNIHSGDVVCSGKGTLVHPGDEIQLPSTYVGEIKNNMSHGYGKITRSDGTVDEGFWENDVLVERIPANAHVSGSDWKCNSGYIKVKHGKSCTKIPKNASETGESSWKCNSGYFKSGKSCAKLPDNASISGESGWKCDLPFKQSGNFCITIPLNASASGNGSWKCNSGYFKNNKVCIPLNASATGESSWKCNSGYFKSGKSCAKIPKNASATGESSWKCNSGYFKSGKSCAKIPKNASATGESSWECNPPLEQSGNFCITIPNNASASGDGDWECNPGSKKIGDICKLQQIKNLHFHPIGKNIDNLDFSSTNFCDISPKVQLRNNNFYLPNQENPYSGENLCVYLLNEQYYSRGEIKKGLRQDNWTYWHQNGQKMAEGLYLDGVPVGQWNYWDENGQESNNINISEFKINTAKTNNVDASGDTIDYESEKYFAQPIYLECFGLSEVTVNTFGENNPVGTELPSIFSLTIDKENNNVTYETLIGINFKAEQPKFKPTQIIIDAIAIWPLSMFDVIFHHQITIDRTDLSYEIIEASERADESVYRQQSEGSGECSTVEVKETQI